MSDKFRKIYRPLHEDNAKLVVEIKEAAEKLDALLSNVKSREMSLAVTNLEQATMWATKAVVLADEANGSNALRVKE